MQRTLSLPWGRFWRYNYQIIAGGGYWVLAIPVAVSQVITLWMMALSSEFSQHTANRIGEMMTPVLAAFLVAHSLAPEYRSGVGAVLASKPVSLGRVLTMRVGLGMLFALFLSLVTLQVCSIGLRPVNVFVPLAASLPAVWFLSTLGLLFATIFRNPLGGFAVALAMWCLDFALGFGVHPLLSAQGFSAMVEKEPLTEFWVAGKTVQVVAGIILWAVHVRQLPRLCRPPEHRDVLRMVAVCSAVLVLYGITGACTVVSYAYQRRGMLGQRDADWIRRALQVYGPLPVSQLFGPAFHAYVSVPPNSDGQTRSARVRQLEQALERWPSSIWADSVAFELASQTEAVEPQAAPAAYLSVAARYGSSPFAPKALTAIIRIEGETVTDAERLLAARRLLADYAERAEAEAGAEELRDHYPSRVKAEELLESAQKAERVAPFWRKPEWLLHQAEMEEVLKRPDDARKHALAALSGVRELQNEIDQNGPRAVELRPFAGTLGNTAVGADEVLKRLR